LGEKGIRSIFVQVQATETNISIKTHDFNCLKQLNHICFNERQIAILLQRRKAPFPNCQQVKSFSFQFL